MTVRPEPRPIFTGATLHTICITEEGTPRTYTRYLLGCMMVNLMKISMYIMSKPYHNYSWWMVSLYDLMLHPFKHKGHCVASDSAYTGYVMCQVGQEEWWHSYGWHCSIVTYWYSGGCSLAKEGKLSKKMRSTRELINYFPINTVPSHCSLMLGQTITLWGQFLVFILQLLYKEESREGNKTQ